MKNFFFDDGRLLRIGGDTRARYTYCQCYALPALWLAAEFLRDADAVRLRTRYLELLLREQACNRDGSFYGERLRGIREQSTYYYTRLESDPALVLSQDLRWRRFAALPEPAAEPLPECLWSDPFHGAYLRKNRRAVRSFVQRGAAGPVALCLPADRSDLAEWEGNLFCRIGLHRCEVRQGRGSGLFRSLRFGDVCGIPAIRGGRGALSGGGEPVCGRGAARRAEHAGAGAGRGFEREHL